MGLQKGQTNNRAGRPPKGRALAERLTAALNKSGSVDGKNRKKAVILADVVIDALINGKVVLPNGVEVLLEPREWIDLTKFVFSHVDGPAKSQHELTGADGGPLVIKGYVTINPDDWDKTDSDIQPATVAG